MKESKILILGDLAPIGVASDYFRQANREWFTGGLGSYWDCSDFRVVNLECPIISNQSPINKVGPCLGVCSESVAALNDFSLISLANNHIMDHGASGLGHTTELLDQAGLPNLGVGQNLSEAGRPHIAEIDGLRVGFMAWSHHELCIATDS